MAGSFKTNGPGLPQTPAVPAVKSFVQPLQQSLFNFSITVAAGALALVGNAAAFDTGMNFEGQQPSVVQSKVMTPSTGALTATGVAPRFDVGMISTAGNLALSGNAPSVSVSGSGTNTNITPTVGALFFGEGGPTPVAGTVTFTGAAPVLRVPVIPSAGTLTFAGIAPSVSAPTAKAWYLANATSSGWRILSETIQTAATINDGWVVGTGAVNNSEYAVGVERPASTFVNTNPPDGSLDTSLKDAFRTETSYLGSFASANWTFHYVVRAVTSATGQDGNIVFRMIKADADGSNATLITAGIQPCTGITNVSTGDNDSALVMNPGPITLTNQYLFFQIAWQRTGGATNANADVNWRTGSGLTSGTRITSSIFTDGNTSITITPTVGALTLTGIAPGIAVATQSLTPSTGQLFFGDVQAITPGRGTLTLTGGGPVSSPQIQPSAGVLVLESQNAGLNQARITPNTATPLKIQQWARIGWAANTEPDLAGYHVYWYGSDSTLRFILGIKDIPAATGLLFYVWEGLTYGNNYFDVTAYDTSDNESAHSSAVSTFISGGGWSPTKNITLPRAGLTGGLTLLGNQPTVVVSSLVITNTNISVFSGALSLTGQQPTSQTPQYKTPVAGSLVLSGSQPTAFIQPPTTVSPLTASLSLTATAPTLSQYVGPLSGTLTLNGRQPTLVLSSTSNFDIAPFSGALTVTGIAPADTARTQTASLSLTGGQPTASINTSQQQTPSTASLTFAGIAPLQRITITPDTANITITGRGAEWRQGILPSHGLLGLFGQPVPPLSFAVQTQAGSLSINGTSSLLSRTLQTLSGSLSLAGQQPLNQVPGNLSKLPFAGSLTLSGAAPVQAVTITPGVGQLFFLSQLPAPPNKSIRPSVGSLVFNGQQPVVQATPYDCYPKWNTGQTWGGHAWCAHRRTNKHTTDQLDTTIYYLSVEITQTGESDFVIVHIVPDLNINAQLPDKYQAKVDRHDIERLSIEIVNGSDDDFIIQSIRPVLNLRKKWRGNT